MMEGWYSEMMSLRDGKLVKRVAIFGGAEAKPDDVVYQDAFEVARCLAEYGFTVVNGGGPGVMVAATNGAESVNGDTLTVTLEPKYAPGFEEKYLENHADKEIPTKNYSERLFTLVAESDFYVVMNGGTGTLSELGMIWCLARLYQGHHKGFVLFGDFWREIIAVLEKNMMIRPDAKTVFEIVTSPEEVVAAIGRFEERMAGKTLFEANAGEEAAFMVGQRANVDISFEDKGVSTEE